MPNISRLTLVAVLTIGTGGLMGLTAGLMPTTTAAAQDCRVSPTACPPTSSSVPSTSSSSEPSTSSEPPTSSEPEPSSEPQDPSSEPKDPSSEPIDPYKDPKWEDDKRISCRVGKDEPITNDLWIINTGEHILEHDLRVRWRVPATGEHGAFLLPKDIMVGQERVLRDLLSDVKSGSECRIEIVD